MHLVEVVAPFAYNSRAAQPGSNQSSQKQFANLPSGI